jgi:hypothetical protein
VKKKLLLVAGLLAVFGLIVSTQASGTASKWSKELVILADTGSGQKDLKGVLVGKQVATENPQVLMVPYCFTVGNLAFISTVEFKSDGTKSRPSVVTPFGVAPFDSSVNCENTSFSAVVSPAGERYIIWNEFDTQREWDDEQEEWVTTTYSQIKISALDGEWEPGSVVVSREAGNRQSQFTNLEVLFAQGRIFVSGEWATDCDNFCSGSSQILLADSTDHKNWTDRVTFVSPQNSNGEMQKSAFFASASGNVFFSWQESNSDSYAELFSPRSFLSHWSSGTWGDSLEIEGFPYATGLARSPDIVSFWTFNDQTRLLRVVDYQISARAFQSPVFETLLPSTQIEPQPPGPSLFSDGFNDTITVLWQADLGVALSVITNTNSFTRIPGSTGLSGLARYGYQPAIFSPGGKPAIFYEDRFFFFDSGKWIEEPFPSEARGYLSLDWFDDGNLSLIRFASGDEDFSGIVGQTLRKDSLPKLESPTKVTGSAKVGQTLTVTQPSWASYSKITNQSAVSWISCTKKIAKQVATMPSNCSPIRNSSGLTYRLTTADKGKYITTKMTSTNYSGTASIYLPTLGPVK